MRDWSRSLFRDAGQSILTPDGPRGLKKQDYTSDKEMKALGEPGTECSGKQGRRGLVEGLSLREKSEASILIFPIQNMFCCEILSPKNPLAAFVSKNMFFSSCLNTFRHFLCFIHLFVTVLRGDDCFAHFLKSCIFLARQNESGKLFRRACE
jgi:hypothetical protein